MNICVAVIGLFGIALAMVAVFVFARRVDNYGVVDAAWGLLFAPLALWYVVAFEGSFWRQTILLAMVAIWSLRLGSHLARRIVSAHPEEDRRYEELRTTWGRAVARRMFWFYQLQGVFILVLSTPIFLAAADPRPGWGGWETAGLILFAVALAGEAVSDAQLRRFKTEKRKHEAVCETGLWRYSRHPNYFFEWLIWVGFALYALGAPFGWVGLVAPGIMLWLLVKVTGIPPTEAQAVKTKGEAYRAYQRTTSAFFPWFRKSSPSARESSGK